MRINPATSKAAPPSRSLPNFPACNIAPRHRFIASRESCPTISSGNAAPNPKASMTAATANRLLPCAANTDAAPSVGPTQGLHTAPSNRPSRNWPRTPSGCNLSIQRCPALLTPPAARATRVCKLELNNTMPSNASIVAEARRNHSPSTPMAKPMVATNSPTATNDITTPAASAGTPSRCVAEAGASTIGNSGNTQGDSVDSSPANTPKPTLAVESSILSVGLADEGLDRGRIGIAG